MSDKIHPLDAIRALEESSALKACIEALERENAALRDDDAKMQLLHRQEDQLIAAERKLIAAEADKARLSEALRTLLDCPDIADNDDKDEETHAAERVARAALSGSGWRLVPYLWQCKDYADGWLSFANEDEAQAYQRDTGCAVMITYRPLPAAPQQGGE